MRSIRNVTYEHFIRTVIEVQCHKYLDCRVPAYDGMPSDRHNMACTEQDFHPKNGKRFPSRRFNLQIAQYHHPEDLHLHPLENIKYHAS